MHAKDFHYYHGDQELLGYLAFDPHLKYPRPVVLVAHDWSGRNAFACKKAELLAEMGYVGFALDMYGAGKIGKTTEEKMALMQPLINDRPFLQERITAALNAASDLPEVDEKNRAAIGFCFGGLCVLDLARTGADIKGVVSFHGLLGRPTPMAEHKIKAKILALHGYDDPMVKPEAVNEFCKEMTAAQVDWQVHQYGQTEHAFTNPEAHDHAMGTVYNKTAEHRSLQAMKNFLQSIIPSS